MENSLEAKYDEHDIWIRNKNLNREIYVREIQIAEGEFQNFNEGIIRLIKRSGINYRNRRQAQLSKKEVDRIKSANLFKGVKRKLRSFSQIKSSRVGFRVNIYPQGLGFNAHHDGENAGKVPHQFFDGEADLISEESQDFNDNFGYFSDSDEEEMLEEESSSDESMPSDDHLSEASDCEDDEKEPETSAITAAVCFGANRRVKFQYKRPSRLSRINEPEPSEPIFLELKGGDYYSFSRGYFFKNGRLEIKGINATHTHQVVPNEKSESNDFHVSIVMFGCT